ncbi:MAG: DUF5674 family protein [bacterium]
MKIITEKSTLDTLWQQREVDLGDMVKIVVDIEKGILALDAELHADLEEMLLEEGSQQQSLWGANIYPGKTGDDFIEYTSFINIRPSQGNRSMEVQDEGIKQKMLAIVTNLLG